MGPRYGLARRQARELLMMCNIVEPAVPVENLVEKCGAIVKYAPFDGELSGMLYTQANGLSIIGVNSTDSPTRQRFTIAHEIGHLLLHRGENVHIDEKPSRKRLMNGSIQNRDAISSQATDPREIEANQFAAELLMPEDFIFKSVFDLAEDIPVDQAIKILSDTFGVSLTAMTHRLTNLKILTSSDEVAG